MAVHIDPLRGAGPGLQKGRIIDYYGVILSEKRRKSKQRKGRGRKTMSPVGKDKCPNQAENMKNCNCSYNPCSRKGICCECIAYHRSSGELPACYFPDSVEKSYDRSIQRFLSVHKK